jgi:hypothetical protein
MKRTTGRAVVAVVGLMYSILSAGTASAQWHSSFVGVGEVDTKHTALLLGGVSASPGGMGVVPDLGVQGYYLTYNGFPSRVNVYVLKPYVGLNDNYNGGTVGANIGYDFVNRNGQTPVGVTATAAEQGKGVVVSGNWDYWGTGGPTGYQALGSYNFGSKSLWTRGRVTERVRQNGPSQTRVGAEVAYLEGAGYSAIQPGGVLEFHDAKGNIFGLGAGMKFFGHGGGNAVYFKAETVLPLMR